MKNNCSKRVIAPHSRKDQNVTNLFLYAGQHYLSIVNRCIARAFRIFLMSIVVSSPARVDVACYAPGNYSQKPIQCTIVHHWFTEHSETRKASGINVCLTILSTVSIIQHSHSNLFRNSD